MKTFITNSHILYLVCILIPFYAAIIVSLCISYPSLSLPFFLSPFLLSQTPFLPLLLSFRLQRKDKVSVVLATSPPSTKPSPTSMGKTKLSANHPFITQPMSSTKDTPSNIYITQHRDEPQLSVTNPSVIQHMQGVNRTSSTASSSPWNHKRNMENNHGSSSTLNSGSLVHQSQDSFIKKPDIHSASGSDFASLQFSQPDMQSCRTSRDSLSQQHKRKIANPSISSGGSGSTEMTERYQTTALLSPTEEEVGIKRDYRMPSISDPNKSTNATYIDV